MKHIRTLLLISLFFPPFLLPAQSWFEGNPQWVNHYEIGFGGAGFEYVTVHGDTVLGGYSAKVLKRFIDYNVGNDVTYYKPVRQNGDTIWGWENTQNKFFMYYNFSLGIGDTVVVPPYWGASFPLTYVIDSIGTMEIGGQLLRFQRVDFPTDYDYFLCKALIIEKMGMVSGRCTNTNVNYTYATWEHFFLDEPCTIAVDGPCWFFCRFQNDQFTYQVSDSQCDGLVVASDITAGSSVLVSPNPFQDYFIVTLPPGENISVLRLLDVSGKVVLQISNPTETKIHAGDLPPGVYFFEILSSAQKRYFGKLAH